MLSQTTSGAAIAQLATASGGREGVATPLLRPSPVARAEVALHGPRRAAVMLHAADGRWPEHRTGDRMALGLGLAALAAQGLNDSRWEGFRQTLAHLARGVAAVPDGPLPGDLAPLERLGVPGTGFLAVVPWEGPGRATVEVQLLDTRGGLVPRLEDPPEEAGPLKEIAALALLIALAADSDPDRLALALGIEGVLGWYREADRLSAPRSALAYALAHVRGRLAEAGRPVPPGL